MLFCHAGCSARSPTEATASFYFPVIQLVKEERGGGLSSADAQLQMELCFQLRLKESGKSTVPISVWGLGSRSTEERGDSVAGRGNGGGWQEASAIPTAWSQLRERHRVCGCRAAQQCAPQPFRSAPLPSLPVPQTQVPLLAQCLPHAAFVLCLLHAVFVRKASLPERCPGKTGASHGLDFLLFSGSFHACRLPSLM